MRKIWLSSVLILTACTTSLQPITDEQSRESAESLKAQISESQEPPSESVTLYEAMARAIKYNLEHRVSMMEIELAQAEFGASHSKRFPQAVLRGRASNRNNQLGTSSLSLITGRQSLEPSTASERTYQTADLSLSWNILDLGLSKLRSEQLADRVLIQEERRRKAAIQVISDVEKAYWRALSAQRLGQSLLTMEADVQASLEGSRALYTSRNTSPMPVLVFQRELNDIRAEAQRLASDLSLAKSELAGLMGLSPDQPFLLTDFTSDAEPRNLTMGYDEMLDVSLRQRPEVREAFYAKRINERTLKTVVLETLPSLEAFAGLNASSNKFLFNSNWADYGARASWNLTKILTVKRRKDTALQQGYLEEQRGLAAAIAVMTQLAIARTLYESLLEAYYAAEEGARIQTEILNQAEALFKAGSVSRQSLVKERMNSLIAESRRDVLQAEIKQAAAHIYASMGAHPYGADIRGDEDVATLAANLESHWRVGADLPEI